MKRIIYSLLLPAMLLFSCSSMDGLAPDTDTDTDTSNQIQFNCTIELPGGNGAVATKTATTTDFKTTFVEGDSIGLYAVIHPEFFLINDLASSGNYIHNVKLTYQGGNWKPSKPIYYAGGGYALDFYAYYPYDAIASDPLNMTFTVKPDQTGDNYNQSDLLIANSSLGVTKGGNVNLQFIHTMSMVQVEVKKEVNVPNFSPDFKVMLKGAKASAKINLQSTSGTADPAAPSSDFVMHKVEGLPHTYRALVPKQTLGPDAKITFVQTTSGKEIDMSYTGIANAALKDQDASFIKKYSVTLGWGINPDHVYALGEVYPHMGTAIGVVFEISNGGRNGKIVSLDEVTDSWGRTDIETYATSNADGLLNMAKVYAANGSSFVDYPIFLWAAAKNPSGTTYSSGAKNIWYIPSNNEMMNLHNKFATDNSSIISAGGVGIAGILYLCSTELSLTEAIRQGGIPISKSTPGRVRAIMAF